MEKVFKGGVPYALDVKKLEECFAVPTLSEGRLITHSDLETALGFDRYSGRYYPVVNSWMHKQRNTNDVFMIWEPTQGIKVLRPDQRLEYFEVRTKQKLRQTKRALAILAWVPRDRLDEIGQRRYDHHRLVSQRIAEALTAAKKDLAIELAPVKSLPKP